MDNLTLSLATIGDLLLKNRITRKENGKPIDNIRLTIPEYQRPYKWTARNAIQLLDDILEARNSNKEVYRVGTLILHKTQNDNGQDVYEIVDGQQRTITFSLLLTALYELEEDQEKRPVIDFLYQQVFDNPLQHSGVHQSRHNHEKHSDDDYRRGTESGVGLLGIEHARDIQDADGTEEHQVGAQLGEQQDAEHSQHRDNGDPRIYVKT